jgi:hypothetical protein
MDGATARWRLTRQWCLGGVGRPISSSAAPVPGTRARPPPRSSRTLRRHDGQHARTDQPARWQRWRWGWLTCEVSELHQVFDASQLRCASDLICRSALNGVDAALHHVEPAFQVGLDTRPARGLLARWAILILRLERLCAAVFLKRPRAAVCARARRVVHRIDHLFAHRGFAVRLPVFAAAGFFREAHALPPGQILRKGPAPCAAPGAAPHRRAVTEAQAAPHWLSLLYPRLWRRLGIWPSDPAWIYCTET